MPLQDWRRSVDASGSPELSRRSFDVPRLALSGFQGGGVGGGGSSGSLTGLTRSARRAASLERSSDAPSAVPLPALFPASPSVRCLTTCKQGLPDHLCSV
jgi:hypothetical protein